MAKISLVNRIKDRLFGICPECGSKNLATRRERRFSHKEYENFPSGCFFADYEVYIIEKIRFCRNEGCNYERTVKEKEEKVTVSEG